MADGFTVGHDCRQTGPRIIIADTVKVEATPVVQVVVFPRVRRQLIPATNLKSGFMEKRIQDMLLAGNAWQERQR
jgi:hypothetical protein